MLVSARLLLVPALSSAQATGPRPAVLKAICATEFGRGLVLVQRSTHAHEFNGNGFGLLRAYRSVGSISISISASNLV